MDLPLYKILTTDKTIIQISYILDENTLEEKGDLKNRIFKLNIYFSQPN